MNHNFNLCSSTKIEDSINYSLLSSQNLIFMNILPSELILHILDHLNFVHAIKVLCTCKAFYDLPYKSRKYVDLRFVLDHSRRDYFVNMRCVLQCVKDIRWPVTVKRLFLDRVYESEHLCLPEKLFYLKIESTTVHTHQIWPHTLKQLHVHYCKLYSLPSYVKHLMIYHCVYAHHLAWPTTLESLDIIGSMPSFTQAWPSSLTCLILSTHQSTFFELPALPDTLRTLKIFVDSFRARIHLSTQLVRLHLSRYDYPISYFSSTLTSLSLMEYNHAFTCDLPSMLRVLILNTYNHKFDKPFPSHLKQLTLQAYNHMFEHPWPETLRTLHLCDYNKSLNHPFPKTLKTLILKRYNLQFNHDLPSLARLHLYAFTHSLKDQLPSTLKKLYLGKYNCDQKFPLKLKSLTLITYNHKIESFPISLNDLRLGVYNHVIELFPSKLQSLHLHAYNHVITRWPSTLTRLIMNAYDQMLPPTWPESLQYVRLEYYNQSFLPSWPAHVQRVILTNYSHRIDEAQIRHITYFKIQGKQYLRKTIRCQN